MLRALEANSSSLLEWSTCSFPNFLSGELDEMLFCSKKFMMAFLSISCVSKADILFLTKSGSPSPVCL